MNKKTKRKYWIAAIIWFVTMVLWVVAAYILFKDLMQPRIGRRKDEEEDK